MPPVGFEPTVPVDERPQTYTLDRAATGTGNRIGTDVNLITVQEDATYSVYYISVGSSTCFGC